MLQSLPAWANIIGYIGVALVLYAYYLSQAGKVNAHSYFYALINIIAALCLLVSLYYHPNRPSIVIEVVWLMLSIYGLVRVRRQRQQSSAA